MRQSILVSCCAARRPCVVSRPIQIRSAQGVAAAQLSGDASRLRRDDDVSLEELLVDSQGAVGDC